MGRCGFWAVQAVARAGDAEFSSRWVPMRPGAPVRQGGCSGRWILCCDFKMRPGNLGYFSRVNANHCEYSFCNRAGGNLRPVRRLVVLLGVMILLAVSPSFARPANGAAHQKPNRAGSSHSRSPKPSNSHRSTAPRSQHAAGQYVQSHGKISHAAARSSNKGAHQRKTTGKSHTVRHK